MQWSLDLSTLRQGRLRLAAMAHDILISLPFLPVKCVGRRLLPRLAQVVLTRTASK
jgi:hypothetical protein